VPPRFRVDLAAFERLDPSGPRAAELVYQGVVRSLKVSVAPVKRIEAQGETAVRRDSVEAIVCTFRAQSVRFSFSAMAPWAFLGQAWRGATSSKGNGSLLTRCCQGDEEPLGFEG